MSPASASLDGIITIVMVLFIGLLPSLGVSYILASFPATLISVDACKLLLKDQFLVINV